MRIARQFLADTCGATAIEYGFLVCLIAIAAMGSMGLAGNALANTLFGVSNSINSAPATVGKS
jgi:Flp pilus assembly pilin Flp